MSLIIDPNEEAARKAHLIPNKTEEQLKQLALDAVDNKIFTDRHFPQGQQNMVPMVFMPIGLGLFKDWTKDEISRVGMIYEDLSKAGPRSVNGLPTFMSLQMINVTDFDKFAKYADEYMQLKDMFLKKKGETNDDTTSQGSSVG